MFEDKALVKACLLKVSAGAAEELTPYQLEILQTAGFIQPYDTPSGGSYQLTKPGKDWLWPPEKK